MSTYRSSTSTCHVSSRLRSAFGPGSKARNEPSSSAGFRRPLLRGVRGTRVGPASGRDRAPRCNGAGGSAREVGRAGTVARSQLIADLESLTAHGALRQVPEHCSVRQRGHLGLAADLGTLATLFREHWTLIENKTPLSRRELDELSELSCRLMSGIGVRRHRKKNERRAAALRARAFTHFVRAYDEVRRAVCYLRWHHDDADTIILSLYAKRTRRRRRENEGAKAEQATAQIPTHEPSAPLEHSSSRGANFSFAELLARG